MNVLKIYMRDIKKITTNYAALIIIIGLMILPSLYAWFNIKSSWDPYGNTGGISIGVVNKDTGAEINGIKIDLGDEIVGNLKENKDIGWKFISEEEAKEGVLYGKYYATIEIPEDFSSKIITILEDDKEKPQLIYSVNEKVNAIAPKITEKGATSLQQEVSKSFIEEVNGAIFQVFNELGINLESNKPHIEGFINLVYELEKKMPEINEAINNFYDGAIGSIEVLEKVDENIPLAKDVIEKSNEVLKSADEYIDKSNEGLNSIEPIIKANIESMDSILEYSIGVLESIDKDLEGDPSVAISKIEKVEENLSALKNISTNLKEFLNKLNAYVSSEVLTNVITKLEDLESKLDTQLNLLSGLKDKVQSGELSKETLTSIINNLKDLNGITNWFIDNYDSTIKPEIDNTVNKLKEISSEAQVLLNEAYNAIPELQNISGNFGEGLKFGVSELEEIKGKLPALEGKITDLSNEIKKLESEGDIDQLIELLENSVEEEKEFIANPVDIKENRIFPIPNYGSGMSPFFTTLALWVGALILVSILSVDIHQEENEKKFKPYEVYFGRYLTFATIAFFQGLIVSLGDLFILKTYVVNKPLFVIYSVSIAMLFTLIVYSLVSVFGNVGKAFAIILLVLQISASGGTFPVEVTPEFFQIINPLLPFTYAIGIMREAVAGPLMDVVLKNTMILISYGLISVIMALLLKKNINKLTSKFVKKFNESGMSE